MTEIRIAAIIFGEIKEADKLSAPSKRLSASGFANTNEMHAVKEQKALIFV